MVNVFTELSALSWGGHQWTVPFSCSRSTGRTLPGSTDIQVTVWAPRSPILVPRPIQTPPGLRTWRTVEFSLSDVETGLIGGGWQRW